MPGMLSQASISLQFLLLVASLPSSTPTCFLPNGTAHQDEGTSRCSSISSSPLYNTCCQTQWPNPPGGDVINGPTADECMPNGLCQNRGFSSAPGQEAEPWTHFYRVYCANANWEGCLDVCRDGNLADSVSQLTPCDGTAKSEYWCCGDSNACCSASADALVSKRIRIPKELGGEQVASASAEVASPSASPASSSAGAGAASSSANPTSSTGAPAATGTSEEPTPSSDAANLSGQNEEKKDEGKSNSGRNIGIGVGVGAGVGALLGVAAVFLLRRRKRHQKTQEIENEIAVERQKQDVAKAYHVAEMPHQEPVYELHDGSRADLELDGANKSQSAMYR
ncbi:hypothetical protein BKA58DRAFT_440257 [Alternaria rosae]|uniref:uncharacterized protein n=1 Tax=Alternaria rosae TaxID=1187941 RepID=UPI001E8E62EA|nr:uncharacterized protein BKA58DRAFT_440257 [Alternaria rosae]KAH6870718.1 hypothetical protein BKA58DRAFT_440257 [Alternaria rosae]